MISDSGKTNDDVFGDKPASGIEFNNLESIAVALLILSRLRARPPLFELGQVVATPGAVDLFDRVGANANDYLVRHVGGDWGDVCTEDAETNWQALRNSGRIFSVYQLGTPKESLWIITESDRRVTTFLLPGEY